MVGPGLPAGERLHTQLPRKLEAELRIGNPVSRRLTPGLAPGPLGASLWGLNTFHILGTGPGHPPTCGLEAASCYQAVGSACGAPLGWREGPA